MRLWVLPVTDRHNTVGGCNTLDVVTDAILPHIRVNLHALSRHTNATLMLGQLEVISERLGHGSVAMTSDLYAHASPGLQQAAAHGFDKVLRVVGVRPEIEEMSRV